MNFRALFYLFLAIAGGGYTWYQAMMGVMAHHGQFDVTEFISSTWTTDLYARSLTLDFWTGAVAGTFFILAEGYRLKMKRVGVYLLLTVLVAFAFGFPFFLFMRELKLSGKDV